MRISIVILGFKGLIIRLDADLPGPLLIGRASIESYLLSKKIYSDWIAHERELF